MVCKRTTARDRGTPPSLAARRERSVKSVDTMSVHQVGRSSRRARTGRTRRRLGFAPSRRGLGSVPFVSIPSRCAELSVAELGRRMREGCLRPRSALVHDADRKDVFPTGTFVRGERCHHGVPRMSTPVTRSVLGIGGEGRRRGRGCMQARWKGKPILGDPAGGSFFNSV